MNCLHPIKIKNLTIKNNILLAPLAGYTFLPTRKIYRMQGEILCYTEMVSAEGLHYSFNKSAELLTTDDNDTPLGVQIFGPDAEKIVRGFVKIKNYKFDLIDINCGCSIKKVLKSKSGAYLLNSPDEIYKIIIGIKNETDKPVTLKIRSGYNTDNINYLDTLEAAISAKADLITFHPRTRTALFTGKADWSLIKKMKERSTIPVIGNGDIFTSGDAVRMIAETNCDGIMIARGIIENPFLIEEIFAVFSDMPYTHPSIQQRIERLLEHCLYLVNFFGEERGLKEFRKFIKGYLKSLPEVASVRQKLNGINNFLDFERTLLDYQKRIV